MVVSILAYCDIIAIAANLLAIGLLAVDLPTVVLLVASLPAVSIWTVIVFWPQKLQYEVTGLKTDIL